MPRTCPLNRVRRGLLVAWIVLYCPLVGAEGTESEGYGPWPEASPEPGGSIPRPSDLGSSLTVGLAYARTNDDQSHLAGSVVLSLPTAAWLGARRKAKSVTKPAPAEAHTATPLSTDELEPCPEPAKSNDSIESRRLSPVPVIRTRDARAALRAALHQAGLASRRTRLDDLASRARWSAALPEVRLRVTRLIDEASALSPTSYDAARRTERGGASLWLEARTTWHLDRALFSSEEVRLERLRYQSARQRHQTSRELLALLFEWQRAAATLLDLPTEATAVECRAAQLAEQQLALELDIVTGGWFGQWARKRENRRPTSACASPRLPRRSSQVKEWRNESRQHHYGDGLAR